MFLLYQTKWRINISELSPRNGDEQRKCMDLQGFLQLHSMNAFAFWCVFDLVCAFVQKVHLPNAWKQPFWCRKVWTINLSQIAENFAKIPQHISHQWSIQKSHWNTKTIHGSVHNQLKNSTFKSQSDKKNNKNSMFKFKPLNLSVSLLCQHFAPLPSAFWRGTSAPLSPAPGARWGPWGRSPPKGVHSKPTTDGKPLRWMESHKKKGPVCMVVVHLHCKLM